MALKPVTTSRSRVFLIEGGARPDHAPVYESCLRMLGITQSFGDIEKIECPDPNEYGKFITVGQTRGAVERATTSLEGRYALNLRSTLLTLAKRGCSVDVHLHVGECKDPSDFNDFDKAIVLEDTFLTSYNTDDIGALASGDDAAVNENADISAESIYEILTTSYTKKAESEVVNEVLDVTLCDTVSCGDCETESDGCQNVYAITKAAGGSPSTPADIVFTLDGGTTWYAHDIESLGIAEDPSEIDCLGSYLVVVSNASGSLHYALKSEHDGITDPDWTEVTTGFVGGGEPNAIDAYGGVAFIVGDGGYIYSTTDPTSGVTVLDAGVAKSLNYFAVDAMSEEVAVAVGESGAIAYTVNGTNWAASPSSPVGVGVGLYAVLVLTEDFWLVGGSDGYIYYTDDRGVSWNTSAFPGHGSGNVRAIEMSTNNVMWAAHDTTTPRGRILRSYSGGNSWVVMPESGTMPLTDQFNALAVCSHDPDMVVAVGLADNGTDGVIVLGQSA
jgi:photosystem II stability/assembly factor-like uncharacterized protein